MKKFSIWFGIFFILLAGVGYSSKMIESSGGTLFSPVWIVGDTPTITADESINITSYYSELKTYTVVDSKVTVDFDDAKTGRIVLPSGETEITLANFKSGCVCPIYLKQPSSGAAGTVTFSPALKWGSGIAGVLTVTNSAIDCLYISYNEVDSLYHADLDPDIK